MFCTMLALLKENEESPRSTVVTRVQVEIPVCFKYQAVLVCFCVL